MVHGAQLLHGTWDPPRPGLEPVYPALAGGFLTTAPPGKSLYEVFRVVKFIGTESRGWFPGTRGKGGM